MAGHDDGAETGAESWGGRELSARLHENEEHAELDCGCVLTCDEDGENVAALYKCATCDKAGELRGALRELLAAFDATAAAGRSGVSPAQAIAQRDRARALLAELGS